MIKILTIVIPTYNMEKYLERCLGSLIVEAEKMEKLEVLVVNDGSKDRSSEIAHGYEARYPQTFRVIDKENGNYGSCINVALKIATGLFVKILDADDCFDSEVFDGYMRMLQEPSVSEYADCIVTDYVKCLDGKGKDEIFDFSASLPFDRLVQLGDVPLSIHPRLQMWAVAYRTEIFRKMTYHQTEGISYTDQEWMFLPFSQVERVFYHPGALYRYSLGREGQTMSALKYARDFWMEIEGTENMVTAFNAIGSMKSEAQERFVLQRLENRVVWIYLNFILNMRKPLKSQRDSLIAFDNFLAKTSPEVYSKSDNYRIQAVSQFRIINIWRRKKKFNTASMHFFFFCYSLCRLKDRIAK